MYKAHQHSGYIGKVKNTVSLLCRGEILVELDHDDALTPWCLNLVVNTFKANDKIGFVYTDFAEIYEDNTSHTYESGWGMGYGSYTKQYYNDTWISVANSININPITITNIVGVPNHLRCWKKEIYMKMGGHNCDLPVADDYELLLKTFLNTTFVRIPHLCYLQYRNRNQQNFSLIRNDEITKLSNHLYLHYQDRIHNHLLANLENRWKPSMDLEGKIWEKPYNFREPHLTFYLSFPEETITVVISTYNRPRKLKKAILSVLEQTHSYFEIVVIGDNCPSLEETMESLTKELLRKDESEDNIDRKGCNLEKLKKIRWWNLDKNYKDGGTTPKNYALRNCVRTQWVAYLDDDNFWEKTHLEELIKSVHSSENPEEINFAFSSLVMGKYTIICKEPKLYRIDTSCIMHRYKILIKYGFWKKPQEVGYAHDWELVSRWKNEKYAATMKPTVIYNLENSLNNPKKIYEAYNDQTHHDIDREVLQKDILDDLKLDINKKESGEIYSTSLEDVVNISENTKIKII